MDKEKVLLNAVLCFPIRSGQVLLGRKMRKIGAGLWNGYGGEIDDGETSPEAACRELLEEAKIKTWPQDLAKVAEVKFHNVKADGSQFTCFVDVYTVSFWLGTPKVTAEMGSPTWFSRHFDPYHPHPIVPYGLMMPADWYWLTKVMLNQKVSVEVWYGPHQATLTKLPVVQTVDHFDQPLWDLD